MVMRLETGLIVNAEQRPEFNQQSSAWSHVMVNALAGQVSERLKNALNPGKHEALINSSSGIDHLSYRLSADALKLKGNQRMTRVLSTASRDCGETVVHSIYDDADDDAAQVVGMWRENTHLYQASDQMIGHRRYQEWLSREGKVEGVTDFVPGLIGALNQRYRLQTAEIFDRVRTAEYKPMGTEHIEAVAQSYERSLLNSDLLKLLVKTPGMSAEQITEQIRTFREKVNKGVFIWPLIADELSADLKGEGQKKTGMEMRGRVLQAQDGKLLCWATYFHAPNKPTNRHVATVRRYFKRGVTNAKMHIEDPDIEQLVMDNLPYTELFQDIRSLYPLAADRFGAFLFEEMKIANPNLKFVTAYRLGNVASKPPLELLTEAWRTSVYPVENEKSAKKFGDWGIRHIAWDFNPNGEPAVREGVEGLPDGRVELRPRWDVMNGNIHEVVPKSRGVWRGVQVAHGDISADPLTVNWPL